jgi:hypothetical protein
MPRWKARLSVDEAGFNALRQSAGACAAVNGMDKAFDYRAVPVFLLEEPARGGALPYVLVVQFCAGKTVLVVLNNITLFW